MTVSDEDLLAGEGTYGVRLVCPNCSAREVVELELRPCLEQVPGEARLGLKVKTGKKLHVCGQTALVTETGAVIRLDLDGDAR